MKSGKFTRYLNTLSNSDNLPIIETIQKGFNSIFEGTEQDSFIVDSREAAQLSRMLNVIDKQTDIPKEDLSRIYRKFLNIDRNKIIGPLSGMFSQLERMMNDLPKNPETLEKIFKYLKEYE